MLGFDPTAFRKYLTNTSWLLVEKVISLVLTFATGIWVIRYLGPELNGVYGYVISFVGLFYTLPSLGTKNILIRDLVSDAKRQGTYLGTAFGMHLFGAIVTFFMLSGIAFWQEAANAAALSYILFFATTFFLQGFMVIEYFFHAQSHSREISLAFFLKALISSLLKVTAILTQMPLAVFIAIIWGEQLIVALALCFFYYRKGFRLGQWRWDFPLAQRLFSESWYYILSGMSISVFMNIDQVMIKHMLGYEANGIYAAAVRFSTPWYFIPMMICQALMPAIVRAKAEDPARYKKRFEQLMGLLVWLGLVLSAGVVLIAEPLINLLLKEGYGASIPVLLWHIWASVFVFMGTGSDRWLVVEKLHQLTIWRTAAGALANVGLNLWLIPQMGIQGAALATVLSYALTYYFMHLCFVQTRFLFAMQTRAFVLPLTLLYRRITA